MDRAFINTEKLYELFVSIGDIGGGQFYADAPKGSLLYYGPKSMFKNQQYISYRE